MQDKAAISEQALRDFEEKLRTEGADGFAAGAHPWEDWNSNGLEPGNSLVWDSSALHEDTQSPARAGSGFGSRILEGLASLAVAAALVGAVVVYFADTGDEQQAFSGIQPLPIERNEPALTEDTANYRELVAAAPPVSVDLKTLQPPAAGETPQAAFSPAPAAEIDAQEIPAPAADDMAIAPDSPAAEIAAAEPAVVDAPEPVAIDTASTITDAIETGEPVGADMPAPADLEPVTAIVETTAAAATVDEPAEMASPAPASTEVPVMEENVAAPDEQPAAAEETQTETLALAEPAVALPPAGEPVEAAARTGNWAINLASYTRESTAEKMLATFVGKGVDAEIFGLSINDKPMYRVRIVGYESFKAAQQEIPALEETLGVSGLWASKR